MLLIIRERILTSNLSCHIFCLMILPENACAYYDFQTGRCSAVELGAKPRELLNSDQILRERLLPNIPMCGAIIDETGRLKTPDPEVMEKCGRDATNQIIRRRYGLSPK